MLNALREGRYFEKSRTSGASLRRKCTDQEGGGGGAAGVRWRGPAAGVARTPDHAPLRRGWLLVGV